MDSFGIVQGKRSEVKPNTSRPKGADLLEVQGRMPRIGP
jgi:hypothetical protein